MDEHPWLLIAPWYDWPKRDSGLFGTARATAPIVQKFTADHYVDRFVDDPQASFRFGARDQALQGATPVRKLFQVTHARLYLVTGELVCDVVGLPAPSREKVCQAGAVVRRFHPQPVAGGPTLQRWSLGTTSWTDIAPGGNDLVSGPDADPDPDEMTIPLFPLAPSGNAAHDGDGRTIYFGAIPTASSVHDTNARPQFDSASTYQLRCFVRRHIRECPRRLGRRDCHGPLTWSSASEPFMLADPVDVDGCAQHQVTVAMPDVNALKARATSGRLPATVRFVSPGGSGMTFPRDGSIPGTDAGRFEGADNCFFSIPLITLVAKFVMSLFMGIVLFVFQAWWMLALRFCLPQGVLEDATAVVGSLQQADSAKWAAFVDTGSFELDAVSDSALLNRLVAIVVAFNSANPDRPVTIPPPPPPPAPPVVEAGPLLELITDLVAGTSRPDLVLRPRVTREQVGLT